MAELADAPDLGLRNHRFQHIASRFKSKHLYEGKTAEFGEILRSTNTEQKTCHSSTNSSTRTHQSHAHVRLIIGIGGGSRRLSSSLMAHNLSRPVNRLESERLFHRARNSIKCSMWSSIRGIVNTSRQILTTSHRRLRLG